MWSFAVYRARCCWIALANPRPNGRLLAPGGRFATGFTRDEAMAAVRDLVSAA
jgi:hypothetical protein